MKLAGRGRRHRRLTMHINKVHAVQTIALVARELGEDTDWLADIADEMDPEDGLIWVYDTDDDDDGVMAFSPFGVENIRNLIAIHRDNQK